MVAFPYAQVIETPMVRVDGYLLHPFDAVRDDPAAHPVVAGAGPIGRGVLISRQPPDEMGGD